MTRNYHSIKHQSKKEVMGVWGLLMCMCILGFVEGKGRWGGGSQLLSVFKCRSTLLEILPQVFMA